MDTKASMNSEILAMFSIFKEKRIKLYESFIKDIEDFENWAIFLERLVAYFLTLQQQRIYGSDLKEIIKKELVRLSEGDFITS
jgi:hypothetical protein